MSTNLVGNSAAPRFQWVAMNMSLMFFRCEL